MKTHNTMKALIAISLFIISCTSCSGTKTPVETDQESLYVPDMSEQKDFGASIDNGRSIIALYSAEINSEKGTFTIEPVERIGSYHFNLNNSFPNVLKIVGFGWTPNFWANIKLSHPYPGSGINGYDPRVIAVLPARAGVSMNYPNLGVTANHSVVLYPDGYTRLFDKTNVPGTANPFLAYFKSQPYRVWSSTGVTQETRRWDMNIAGFGGSLQYYLVVDVSTNFPNPPQPIVDNAPEPVEIKAGIKNYLTQLGGTADITVTLLDWQGLTGIGGVKIEAPSLFNGLATLSYSGTGPNPDEYIYTGTISNALLAPQGNYKMLVASWDQLSAVSMYQEFDVLVDYGINFNPVDVTPPHLSYTPYAVSVSGNYAYVAARKFGLHIFDISTPSNPIWLKKVNTTGEAWDISVYGGYAYVADGEAGVQIIDIEPWSSAYIAKTVDTSGVATAIMVRDSNYAFVADDTAGLQIIYITSPLSAYIAKTVDTPGNARDVYVDLNYYVYIADYNGGLQIVDAQPVGSAAIIETYNFPYANCIWVDESIKRAYIGYGTYFAIVNVTDPANVSLIKSLDLSYDGPRDVIASGDYAYITTPYGYLKILDVNPPESASIINTINVNHAPYGLCLSGGNAFIANSLRGLQVVDVNPPESAYLVKTVDVVNWVRGVTVSSDYAYVACEDSGYYIVDISPIPNSHVVNTFTLYQRWPYESVISEGYAYIAQRYGGFAIVDVDPPESAYMVKNVDYWGESRGVCMLDGYALTTEVGYGVHIIDIDPPETASIYKTFTTSGAAQDIVTANGYAFIADGSSGLTIADVDPVDTAASFVFMGLPGLTYGIDYSNGNAYVATGSNGLVIVDVDPPEDAHILNTIDTPGTANRVKVIGGYAYVADWHGGLQIIDIYPTESAYIVSSVNSNDAANGCEAVDVVGQYACMADNGGGLRIIQLW